MPARVYDKDFKYVPSGKTDIRRTFARERKRLEQEQESRKQNDAHKVLRIIVPKRG